MKAFKLLCLAVTAALAVTAFGAVGSASATTLCSVNMANCPPASIYGTGTVVTGEAEGAEIAFLVGGEPFVVECEWSGIKIETLAEVEGEPIPVELRTLLFNGCVSPLGGCEVEGLVPGEGGIEAMGGGNGVATVEAGVMIQCAAIVCVYAAENVEIGITGGNPAALVLNEEPLAVQMGSGPGCGAIATWTAMHGVTNPTPLFVAIAP
jgi:hypothetical protein